MAFIQPRSTAVACSRSYLTSMQRRNDIEATLCKLHVSTRPVSISITFFFFFFFFFFLRAILRAAQRASYYILINSGGNSRHIAKRKITVPDSED